MVGKDSVIQKAFKYGVMWPPEIQTDETGETDIVIYFTQWVHRDSNPFDGIT